MNWHTLKLTHSFSPVNHHDWHFVWRSHWLANWVPCVGIRHLPAPAHPLAHPNWPHSRHLQYSARTQCVDRVYHWLHGARSTHGHDDVQELRLHIYVPGIVLRPGSQAGPLHEGAASRHVLFTACRVDLVRHCSDRGHELGPQQDSRCLQRSPKGPVHLPQWACLLHSFSHLGRHWACSHLQSRRNLRPLTMVLASRRRDPHHHLAPCQKMAQVILAICLHARHLRRHWFVAPRNRAHLPLLGVVGIMFNYLSSVATQAGGFSITTSCPQRWTAG